MGNYISPLRRAIRARDAAKVEELLKEAGESAPDYINEDYSADCFIACMFKNTKSPVHTALSLQDFKVITILLQYGADPQCTSGYLGQTPLHIACRQNNLPLVKLLIEVHKVDVYVKDDIGMCPVHTSCLSMNAILVKDISILRYFHDVGKLNTGDLNLEDDSGNTPLHIAAKYGHQTAIDYLITLGANRNAKNSLGETPVVI